MSAPKPCCKSIGPWLGSNLGKRCLAPLTGSDSRALAAAVHIVEQYSYDPHPSLLEAFAAVVLRMQPSTRELAYHAIAHIREWENRAEMWVEAGLPEFAPRVCAFEPGGTYKECA